MRSGSSREHGLRAVALDPVPRHFELARERVARPAYGEIDVVEAPIEAMPSPTRRRLDLVPRRARPCRRATRARGVRARAPARRLDGRLCDPCDRSARAARGGRARRRARAAPRASTRGRVEAAAREAGLALRSVDRLGGEWRERMIEDGDWDVARRRCSALAAAPARGRARRAVRRRRASTPPPAGTSGASTSCSGSSARRSTSGGAVLRARASLLDLIGNTPLVELRSFSPEARRSACTRSSRDRTRPARSRTASRRR